MKPIRISRACAWLAVPFALLSAAAWPQRAERKPLLSPRDEEVKYVPTGMRTRLDPATHNPIQYAVDGKIAYDQGAGNYTLEWMGVDGQRKKLIWVPPNKLSAEITGAASYNPSQKLFEYSYEVSSLVESRQKLQSFYVTGGSEVVSGGNPDQTWYSSSFTQYLRQVFRTEGGWAWSQIMGGRIGLEPGETAKGFRFRSAGVPTPVSCYVRGYTDMLHSSEDVPEELMDAIDRISWKIPYGLTIGPGLPPDRMSAQQVVQNLSRSLEVGSKQGWILEGSDATAIKQSMEEISRAVSSGNNVDAARQLEEATLLVDSAYRRGVLLSEAHGLLTHNLSTLKQRLTKPGTTPLAD